jgi:hypothetical protein
VKDRSGEIKGFLGVSFLFCGFNVDFSSLSAILHPVKDRGTESLNLPKKVLLLL